MAQRTEVFPHVIEMNYQARRRLGCCVYLVHDAEEWMLIDIGYEDTLDDIIDIIRQLDFRLSQCKYLVATHADVDHVLRCEGETWALTFEGRTIRVRDRKGMHYVARMLEEPQREFHVLDLVGGASEIAGDAGPLLDGQAKDAYRRRLAEVEEDIEEAERLRDLGRAAHAKTERDLLTRELARAFGVGGRDRPAAGSAAERARASVTKAIRAAIRQIEKSDAGLAEILSRTVRTGTFCSYEPLAEVPVRWSVEL